MSAPDANGWFDIETAPDDRREFLVWFPSMQEVGYGFYAEEGYGYPAAFRYFWFNVEEGADLNVPSECPSHWQPLPSPPITNSLSSTHPAMTKPAGSQPSQPAGTPSNGDRERLGGEMPAARKVVFATLLWPLLVPYLFIKGGFSR